MEKIIGDHQLLVIYSAFVKYLRKMGMQWGSVSVI